MPRYVVFTGAPTVQQCLKAATLPAAAHASWRTFSVPLPSTRSTSPRRSPPHPQAVNKQARASKKVVPDGKVKSEGDSGDRAERTSSQFADADTTGLFSSRKQVEVVPSSQPEGEDDVAEPPSKRQRREETPVKAESGDEQETERTRMSFLLPPPSQLSNKHISLRHSRRHSRSQPLFQPSQNLSFRFPPTAPEISNVTTAFTDEGGTYDTTIGGGGGETSMGPPPRLDWQVHQLCHIDHLRKRLGKTRRGDVEKVSVLAAAIDYHAAEDGTKAPSTVSLMDHTGQRADLVLWQDLGRRVCEIIRRGDVLFVSDVVPKEYNGKLQLNFSESHSQIGICWRSNVFDEDDAQYRFHEGWSGHLPQAGAVLREAEFFRKFTDA
ncbi:hypothetical protein JCM11641_003809 [Rhodosporidiobolus odoratus]